MMCEIPKAEIGEKFFEKIDYERYLACPSCRESEPYCQEHRKEVESILAELLN